MKLAVSRSFVLVAVLAAHGCNDAHEAPGPGGAPGLDAGGLAADPRPGDSSATKPEPDSSNGSGSAGYDPRTGEYIPGTMGCPASACGTGAQFFAECPLSFEQALAVQFEVCKNDTCFVGQLSSSVTVPTQGVSTGFRLPSFQASGSDHADLSLSIDEAGQLFVQVLWSPWNAHALKDGDHYVVSIIDAAGKRATLLDERVDYEDHSIGKPDKPCYQFCPYVMVDRREGDAGGN
jgi:hypothetical protein